MMLWFYIGVIAGSVVANVLIRVVPWLRRQREARRRR